MIDYLTQRRWFDYNPHIKPSAQVGGGGMGSKTFRVMEAMRIRYPSARCIVNSSEIRADFVLVEPARFSMKARDGDEDFEAVLAGLKRYRSEGGRIIVYGSEKSMLKLEPDRCEAVKKVAHAFVANCRFQEDLFEHVGIDALGILCEPVPSNIFPNVPFSQRRKRIVACGTVGWFKNIERVIELFAMLRAEDSSIDTGFIGSKDLWNSGRADAKGLERRLRAECSHFWPDKTSVEVGSLMSYSRCGLWVSWHDVYATGMHEMCGAWLPVVAGPHGLAIHTPHFIGYRRADQFRFAQQILNAKEDAWNAMAQKSRAYFSKSASYGVFLSQLQSILKAVY